MEVPCLLESTDFRSMENCFSFIAVEPIATFKVQNGILTQSFSGEVKIEQNQISGEEVINSFYDFINQFEIENDTNYKGINGFFGHTGFDAVQYFDSLDFDPVKRDNRFP